MTRVIFTITIAAAVLWCNTSSGYWLQGEGWPEIYDPGLLPTLYLEMTQSDWDTIRTDGSFSIERPATFWMEGEEDKKITVAVRRKSCDALPDETNPYKVSFKVDINEYFGNPAFPNAVEYWHGVKKLSLENGDDVDVLAEGIACNIHRMASGPKGYGYDVWRTNWAKVYMRVGGQDHYLGVYVNNEHLRQ